MRRIACFALIQLLFLAACGGGGGSGTLGSGTGNNNNGGSNNPGAAANVATLTVDGGPGGDFNIPYVTVTICAPGSTTNCQTINHIEVDTASYGLRIISSVLNSSLLAALPPEKSTAGDPLAECVEFGDGYSWGSMRTADLTVASEKASGIPMQVMGDPNLPAASTTACPNGALGPEEDTVAAFGANGILGVGPFVQDCGQACVDSTAQGFYYSCPTGTGACHQVQVTLAQQASNPVAAFTTDNNGVIIELPSILDTGAAQVTGSLVFGIGTQGNNSLGKAVVLTTDRNDGTISVNFAGNTYSKSIVDSGSNLLFFALNSSSTVTIPQCTVGNSNSSNSNSNTFYCPSQEQTLTASNSGLNGTQSTVTFRVGNAQTLFGNQSYFAFDNVASPNAPSDSFDFGLPFFYGRNVFTAIDGMNTAGGMGPYIAY